VKAGFYLLLYCATLHAQWVNLPIPETPRTPDGKPNLSAPVPRTAEGKPDLSGLWGVNPGNYGSNVAADLKPEDIQPWAADLVKQRAANIGRDQPSAVGCLPHGPSVNTNLLFDAEVHSNAPRSRDPSRGVELPPNPP
jgi:hypothetical protein